MSFDFPVVPPISVKDTPNNRKLETLAEARRFAEEALAARRTSFWRDVHKRLIEASSDDDAIEAIGSLRELLATTHLSGSGRTIESRSASGWIDASRRPACGLSIRPAANSDLARAGWP